MSPRDAIFLVILVAAIVGLAWLLDWIARHKLGAPHPVSLVIWIIAFLLIVLVLLDRTGYLYAATAATMPLLL